MNIAIVGAGPAGVMAAIFALNNPEAEITFFDEKKPLTTLLPTGGGRCNLAYAEFDNSELIQYYSRGGKFLLSVFSRFATGDTIDFFEKIGVKTYIQDDLRIFPVSNSSSDVRKKLLGKIDIKRTHFLEEKVINIKKDRKFKITTDNASYVFDKVIFAGGIRKNDNILKDFGIKIIEPKPALCALCVGETNLYSLSGLTFKNICANMPCRKENLHGDLLITHKSISGPLAYMISSFCAYEKFPLKIILNFVNQSFEEFDKYFIELLNLNSKKDIINIVSDLAPRSFAQYLLNKSSIPCGLKASQIDKNMRTKICGFLTNYELNVTSQMPEGEIVTAGGVDLDYVNPKTMEYKDIPGLYFCGEVLNIDGLTGGFNLQNCWSTGFIAGSSVCG